MKRQDSEDWTCLLQESWRKLHMFAVVSRESRNGIKSFFLALFKSSWPATKT